LVCGLVSIGSVPLQLALLVSLTNFIKSTQDPGSDVDAAIMNAVSAVAVVMRNLNTNSDVVFRGIVT